MKPTEFWRWHVPHPFKAGKTIGPPASICRAARRTNIGSIFVPWCWVT